MLEVSKFAILSLVPACQPLFPLFEICCLISTFADFHNIPQFLSLKAKKPNTNSISLVERCRCFPCGRSWDRSCSWMLWRVRNARSSASPSFSSAGRCRRVSPGPCSLCCSHAVRSSCISRTCTFSMFLEAAA